TSAIHSFRSYLARTARRFPNKTTEDLRHVTHATRTYRGRHVHSERRSARVVARARDAADAAPNCSVVRDKEHVLRGCTVALAILTPATDGRVATSVPGTIVRSRCLVAVLVA